MKRMKWLLISLLTVCLLSCTGTPPKVQPLPRKEPSAATKTEDAGGELQRQRQQIRTQLERHDYLDALRLMQQKVRAGLAAANFAEEYSQALNGGLRYGQSLQDKGQLSECGRYYRRVLELYPRTLTASVGVTPEQLIQRLQACSDQLLARGLAEYRAGQLQQAINSWTALLAFDPERSEAKKALDTCTIQLRNLKTKPGTPLTATTTNE